MNNPAAASFSLTPRDVQILQMVYDFDGCSSEQIARRFFKHAASSGRGPLTACYARVLKLVARGFLVRTRQAAWSGVGSGTFLLQLGPQGRELLAAAWKQPRSELHRPREIKNPYLAAHHLAIGDVRLCLMTACERSPVVALTGWTGERELRVRPWDTAVDPILSTAIRSLEIPLIADGAFTLTLRDGRFQEYLLELDLATVPEPRVRSKLRGYLIHAARDDRPILWVVPHARRLVALRTWIAAEATSLGADPSIFWLATRPALTLETILTPVWTAVGLAHRLGFLPDDGLAGASVVPPGPALIDARRHRPGRAPAPRLEELLGVA